ncbi:MAG: Hsp20/alpha crystallin family protein [Comamonadaceae bacterium]|nr:MAG: Hsp20/alpha crystallin family protein [Comamonadaceae bacterium]
MYRSYSSRDLFAELERLQQGMQQAMDLSPTIRGFAREGFPALNVGGTPEAIEIYAFAPGVDASTLEVGLERGLLTIAGERNTEQPDNASKSSLHIQERFRGRFSRTLSLPDDADPEQVNARLRDGILHVTVRRRASAQPRRIAVQ